ncbi:MAG TPA: thioredoxin domain-containing protein [Actinomycetota bacterium]|nr:thioredoxin domain-containing protein [Actinomycetota bacterium]
MANRLASETSPYLLQHAHNPVDWWPWTPEAFEEAKRRDVPVLLSIGYAACHWCHVMERESFEDDETAGLMNGWFVNVKVDREERPDVDSIYMDAVQLLTGHGGWPMTMFLTPDGVPMLGGTYFPPEDRHGMPSFKRLLTYVHELWTTRRADLLAQGQQIVDHIKGSVPRASTDPLTESMLSNAARQLAAAHDASYGGFGRAPKFPQPAVLELALRLDARGLVLREELTTTLRAMALGGIYDQLGGGFARYSVDERWLVPHFEKMLYDNAQLARVYTHAWQAWGDPLHRRIATETLDYLLRDMLDPVGAFHASEDADSEGVEGKFYVWSYDEFLAIAPDAAAYYGVTPEGNWEETNILTAATTDEPPAEARRKLYEAREHRVRPGRDDKVLASWNGLAIAALAEAGAAFGRDDLIDAARRAATFILGEMRGPDGRLLHSWRSGQAKIAGLLEDHAYLADGLLALWEATFEPRWLEESHRLATEAVERFSDSAGGFFTTASDATDLVVRPKEVTESATPSPAGVLTNVLLRLSVLLDDDSLRRAAVDALRVAHVYMEKAPQAVPTWLGALDLYLRPPVEVAFTGPPSRELRAVVWTRYLPNRVLAGRAVGDHPILERVALLRGRDDAEPTAYVCENLACKLPARDPQTLAGQLDERAN